MRWVWVATGVSLMVMACIFPEMLILGKRSFMTLHDTEIPCENIFALTSFCYHGGLQLWDRFDAMNLSYFQLSAGMYTLVNMASALIYWIFSPLFFYSAEAFYRMQALSFFSLTSLIRIFGGYLLLRHLGVTLLPTVLALIFMNTVLSSHLFLGVLTDNLYSYFPLMMYLLVRITDQRKILDAAWFMLFMAVAVANSPLFTLGYFYVVVHFFILSLLVYVFGGGQKVPRAWAWPVSRGQRQAVLLLVILSVVIVLPQAFLYKSLKTDFFIAHSGLSGQDGRMNHVFDIKRYFDVTGKGFVDPVDFLAKAVDYKNNTWRDSWMFLGVSTLFLSLLGLVLSRQRIKYVFAGTIAAVFLINTVPDPHAPLSVMHWVNALTNPFNFLLRSFHMSTLLMPFLYFPLVAFGLQALFDSAQGGSKGFYQERANVFFRLYLIVFFLSICFVPGPLKLYVGGVEFLWGLVLATVFFIPKPSSKLVLGVVIVIFCLEWSAVSVFIHNSMEKEELPMVARQINGLDTSMPLLLDFQNPKILPFREFDRVDLRFIDPTIYSYQNNFGLFYQFGTLARFMHGPSLYRPMHISYANLYRDREIQWYLLHNPKTFSLADYAAPENRLNFYNVLSLGLGERVAMVGAEEKDPQQLTDPARMAFAPQPNNQSWKTFSFNKSEARLRHRGGSVEYGFKLPDNFPLYLSTTVFTPDEASWNLSVGGHDLLPAQGKLTQDFTFDVQNVKEGWLFVQLPGSMDWGEQPIELHVKMPQGISNVWCNTHDRLGITYEAWEDGWLVIHYPYDLKWQISIDGKPVRVYRVDRYFIGTPISKGTHQVLIAYWPRTPLRFLLGLSLIGAVIGFMAMVVYLWRSKEAF